MKPPYNSKTKCDRQKQIVDLESISTDTLIKVIKKKHTRALIFAVGENKKFK